MARYPNYHSYYFKDYTPTKLITNYLEGVTIDNESHARNYAAYRYLVDLILDKQIEDLKSEGLNSLEGNLLVLKDIESPTILHNRLNRALIHFTVNEVDMEGVRDKMFALSKQEKTKEIIANHFETISKLKSGKQAPTFYLQNYNGTKTKLSDFKGKYVYIDVWATWCGPCILEIPYLKEIEEEFIDSNIEFVSISLDEPRFHDTWRKMIKNKNLSGTQLITENGWDSKFVRDYSVQGIPRFMLIDDIGNLISADAEKPSDPKLKQKLKELGL